MIVIHKIVYASQLPCNMTQSFMLPLIPITKVEDWCSNTSIVLTGTACRTGIGPPVGTVDIGVSTSAYYFCIALPGVKKDPGNSVNLLSFNVVCNRNLCFGTHLSSSRLNTFALF